MFIEGQQVWKQKYQGLPIASRRDAVTRFISEVEEELMRFETRAVSWATRGTEEPPHGQARTSDPDADVVLTFDGREHGQNASSSRMSSSNASESTTCASTDTIDCSLQRLLSALELSVDETLTPDVTGNGDLMSALLDFARNADEFTSLKGLYLSTQKCERKTSKLKDSIAQTEEVLLRVKDQLKDMSSIQIPVSSGLTIASMARSQEKLHKMTIVFKTLVEGKNVLREAVRFLMRRNSGIAHYLMADLSPKSVQLECQEPSMSWDTAVNQQEDRIANGQKDGYLFGQEVLSCLRIIMEESATLAEDFFEQADIDKDKIRQGSCSLTSCLNQILRSGPVLLARHGNKVLVLDIHEYVLGVGDGLVDLLCMCDAEEPSQGQHPDCNISDDSDAEQQLPTQDGVAQPVLADDRSRQGRPAKHVQYPEIVEEAQRFLELHGNAAHERRRNDVSTSLGVTLNDLRKHLLKSVPELQTKGLSRTTVHELLVPPRKRTTNAAGYKQLIQARVPHKRNDELQATHADRHFAQLK